MKKTERACPVTLHSTACIFICVYFTRIGVIFYILIYLIILVSSRPIRSLIVITIRLDDKCQLILAIFFKSFEIGTILISSKI